MHVAALGVQAADNIDIKHGFQDSKLISKTGRLERRHSGLREQYVLQSISDAGDWLVEPKTGSRDHVNHSN